MWKTFSPAAGVEATTNSSTHARSLPLEHGSVQAHLDAFMAELEREIRAEIATMLGRLRVGPRANSQAKARMAQAAFATIVAQRRAAIDAPQILGRALKPTLTAQLMTLVDAQILAEYGLDNDA